LWRIVTILVLQRQDNLLYCIVLKKMAPALVVPNILFDQNAA